MASEEPEGPRPMLPGTRFGSAPVNTTQVKEETEQNVLDLAYKRTVASRYSESGIFLTATRAMSAPDPVLTSDSCQTPSSFPPPNQQESKSHMVTVKTEPGTPRIIRGPSPPISAMNSTVADAIFKIEQPSEISAATLFSTAPREITLKGLRGVADCMDLIKLEAGVTAAHEILDQLRTPLQDFKQHQEVDDWLNLIENLTFKAQKAGRTVVAVAGGTGAGKSSLINSVLGEEKLLPTNGMRACTAVITEVSWNEAEDPQQAYRAEAEFISPEEWSSELRLMYSELLDDNGQLIPSWRDKTTEAGIAYDKVEAVYPELTQDMIMQSEPKDLVQDESVAKFLGSTTKFAYSTAQALYSNLSKFIDSKEKVGAKQKRLTALLPIIRVVKIFVRANALSTGVVLVDLPGTADSNAARSAVAIKYMAECTSVWVVARITRAVDDKEAKNLLGRSSRIQMKLDGAYSHLTFIATQTDGIDIQETVDAVDADGQIKATYAREEQLTGVIEDEERRCRGLDKQLDDLNDELDALEADLKAWRGLQKKHEKGHQVYAPAASSKRSKQTKRRRTSRRQILDESFASDDESASRPLTQAEISAKLEELQASFESKVVESESTAVHAEAVTSNLKNLEQQRANIPSKRASLCVERRNNYCRDAIRQDFAAGIREIDEEDDSADTDNYNPSAQKRDYDEVANSLDVFCISSKAYQQLRKSTRSGKTTIEGFRTLEDTEIPGLQRHAMMSAKPGQIRSNKVYLNQFSQVLNSLAVWTASNDMSLQPSQLGHTDTMSARPNEYEISFLAFQTGELKKQFAELVLSTKAELQAIVRAAFGQRSSAATKYASKQLVEIVDRWGTRENDGGYGLAFSTYKAICKRSGEKTANKKARNFNEEILEPFLQKIASFWEQAFTQTIPVALDKFLATFTDKLREFHTLISSSPGTKKSQVNSMRILANQIVNHEATMKDAISNAKAQIHEEQRLASRMFLPEIKSEMQKVYSEVAAQSGQGSFQRMKDLMTEHIEKRKILVFKKACQKVNKKLEMIFQSITDSLYDEGESIRATLISDYKLVLNSAEIIEMNAVVRDHIREVLMSADTKFDAILTDTELKYANRDVESAVIVPDCDALTQSSYDF